MFNFIKRRIVKYKTNKYRACIKHVKTSNGCIRKYGNNGKIY